MDTLGDCTEARYRRGAAVAEHWSHSKTYRVLVTVALILAGIRMLAQAYYCGMLLYPNEPFFGGTPDWAGNEDGMVPPDLQIYLTAAEHFRHREDLYLQGSLAVLEEHYPYGPAFAFAFIPNLWLSPLAVTVFHTVLHVVLYVLLWLRWDRMFAQLGLTRVRGALAVTLPLFILFAAFWQELGYLNIYLPMALAGTLFIEAVVNERLGLAALWLSVIVQIKPHWAFAAAVPLFLGRYRFFAKLVGVVGLTYLGVAGALAVIAGPGYIGEQYVEYVEFLGRLSRDFPWRGPDAPFLGYNHSVRQIVYYWLGVNASTQRLATGAKLLLLAPLGLIGIRTLLNPRNQPGYVVPDLALDLAFACYLGAFIWLDMVWEVSLGIVIFPYLLATTPRRPSRILLWVVFLPYALVDLWQLITFGIGGMAVMAPGPYILTDYSIYLPLHMVVIVAFYGLVVGRLWPATRPTRVPTRFSARYWPR